MKLDELKFEPIEGNTNWEIATFAPGWLILRCLKYSESGGILYGRPSTYGICRDRGPVGRLDKSDAYRNLEPIEAQVVIYHVLTSEVTSEHPHPDSQASR